MKYGLIGTAYNTGISHIAAGFAQNLNMKALLVETKPFAMFPERFPEHRITKVMSQEDIDWLLSDIDVLFTIETPYRWDVYEQAHKRGVKTVLMPMIEWLNRNRPELRHIDLFVCPAPYTAKLLSPSANKVIVPCEVPVDLTKFKPRQTITARTFLHNGGHGGIGGRNSTTELLRAIQIVKAPAKFIIRSQFPLPNKINDPRVTYVEGNVENYWDLYSEGDVWIMPWKYGVAALGLQESMAAGMLPVITDMEPFNEFMPKELLIKPEKLEWKPMHAGQQELYAAQSPELIAQKIEELYAMETVQPLSHWARATAVAWSWDVWAPKYREMFDALCKKP